MTHVNSKPMARKPLAVGNVYRFKGYRGNGFKIVAMSLPGTPSDDGALPGVAVQWLNHSRHRGWYVFHSEADFWSHSLFSNACDPEEAENANVALQNDRQQVNCTFNDVLNAWMAGKDNERRYGSSTGDAPDFYSWWNQRLSEASRPEAAGSVLKPHEVMTPPGIPKDLLPKISVTSILSGEKKEKS